MAAVPTPRELDDYREQADRFIAAIDEEYYLHFAGHKDSLELEPIYDRFGELTSLDHGEPRRLGGRRRPPHRASSGSSPARATSANAHPRATRRRSARLEAELTATVDGDEIPFRMLRPTMANEPDRDKRQRLENARNALTEEHLLPLQLEAAAGA